MCECSWSTVHHTVRGQTEAIDCPAQVVALISTTQREALTQSRLVDLDDLGAGTLQVQGLAANGKCDLPTGLVPGLVVAHERPLQDGHRPGEHPLDRLDGATLCMLPPANRDRLRASDITEEDRRLDAARAV